MSDGGTAQRHMELHISRHARERYGFDESLFSLSGHAIVGSFHAARVLAQRMNARRDLARFPEQAVKAGQINALGLIEEVLHLVVALYREQKQPTILAQALERLDQALGPRAVDATLRRFADSFPPLAVHRREISIDDYLAGTSGGVANRELLLEELLMLWLVNANPATAPFAELFDDSALRTQTAYQPIIEALRQHFDLAPRFGPADENLLDMLRSPALAVPHSLPGQLEYVRERWGFLLGRLLYRLLGGLDLIREEEKAIFPAGGPGPSLVVDFRDLGGEAERFSPDLDWMPRLVMLAKNAYVWLDQLSRAHRRAITRLDEVPDGELDTLAHRGFTGLWLIGLWERSAASQRIKQLCGNPEAVASAYSLADYRIADDLGGEGAFERLKERAWRRGIRMATDMVPNHMGIDSRWVVEHPDWFVSLDHSPFPAYSFSGPDLSRDARVGIFIEDHYYTRSDAAVVFKRVDRRSGSESYVYHGNDGTSMPWNDTAQLDYLKPEVREAVIRTILDVARRSPIIRFDAAMTLAKRHYHRLWFPEPGGGGAIPSRAGQGLTKEQLDVAMPEELWREVVDRVAAEVPDTLLLAEAFWLMEGYFVRTLGMHRVYNSAFMNMLRDEDNAKYRSVMKNTLEFDPEILKRYVNFMNNPDERTAVDQFGKGDKYFGIATMMATLPGLPMFGHGQVEGFTEKYGMEYRRAYWDEQPDGHLIARHEHELFPLLRRRYLFAGVEHFLLYDFFTPAGTVNEDVFAFSNRAGEERCLVVYHNRFAETRGFIRTSVARAVKAEHQGAGGLAQSELAQGLALRVDDGWFSLFRDQVTGLEYIRSNREIASSGLYVELAAYRRHVFLDFREVQDNQWRQYANLAAYLEGRGVPSISEALRETFLQPLHERLKELLDAEGARALHGLLIGAPEAAPAEAPARLEELEGRALRLLEEVRRLAGGDCDLEPLAAVIRHEVEVLLSLGARDDPEPDAARAAVAAELAALVEDDQVAWRTLLAWVFCHAIARVAGEAEVAERSRSFLDEWLLGRILAGVFAEAGADEDAGARAVARLKLLVARQDWYAPLAGGAESALATLETWFSDREVQQLLGVNRHRGVLWFNKESFENLLSWLLVTAAVRLEAGPERQPAEAATIRARCVALITRLRELAQQSGYQVEKLLVLAKTGSATATAGPRAAAPAGPDDRGDPDRG